MPKFLEHIAKRYPNDDNTYNRIHENRLLGNLEPIRLTYDLKFGLRKFGEILEENKLIFFDDNYMALENADALVLMTEWKMFRNPNLSKLKEKMTTLCIFDGRNQYDPEYMKENGFKYKGIGRQ